MDSGRPDPFEEFVARRGLRITTQDLAAYPRDVLAAPGELDRHILVSLISSDEEFRPVHSLFVLAATDDRPASIRDVMWWLSADSWAYERASGDLHRWAATYGYPEGDPATRRLMCLHARQTDALVKLMGRSAYDELLSLYETEIQRTT